MDETQAVSEASGQTFTCFPRFPNEIKNLIWKWTLEPRVVEPAFDYGGPGNWQCPDSIDLYNAQNFMREDPDEDFEKRVKYFQTTIKTPTALRVCQGSRNAVISSYPLCFGSVWYPPRIRFNFSLDTLYLDKEFYKVAPLFFSMLNDEEVERLRYLALDYDSDGVRSHQGSYFLSEGFAKCLQRCVEQFEGLEELMMVEEVIHLFGWSDGTICEDYDETSGEWDERRGIYPDKIQLHARMPAAFVKAEFPELRSWTKDWDVCKQTVVIGWRESLKWIPYSDEEKEQRKLAEAAGCRYEP